MKLRQIFESKQPSVGIIFGRFNPPHQGHRAAWEMAAQNDQWFVGTNQSTQGPKDPLPYDIKVKAMLAIMPEVKGHIVPETSWLTLASKVYKKYGNIILNVYTDEEWVTKALVQYNGVEGAHGFYNFADIQQHPTPRLSSATALRAAVAAGDRDAFSKAAGVDADTPVAGHSFFDVVAHYLAPHAEKEKAKAAKKKVKEPEQSVAEYGDTAKGQKMLTKVQKRAVDRVTSKRADTDPAYAKKNSDTANRAWDRMDTSESDSKAMAHTVKSLENPPKVMQHRAKRDQERERQYAGSQIAKRDRTSKDEWGNFKEELDELSTELLGRYKKAAGTDASAADKKGDFKRGDKRFSGIVKATKKQFANDEKKTDECAGVGIITKQNSTVDVNKNTPRKNLKAFKLI